MAGTPATLLVVSHDRRLLETVCDRLWVVDRGLAAPFDGGYRAWRAALADGWTVEAAIELESRRLGSRGSHGVASSHASGGRSAQPTRPATEIRRGRRVPTEAAGRAPREAIEGCLPPAQDVRRRRAYATGPAQEPLELAMTDPGVQANFVELRRIGSELADIEAALASAEDAWLDLEDRAP